MYFFRVINSLALGLVLCFASNLLHAAPASTKLCGHHPHRLYFDLGVGKTYDFAHSNSVLQNNDSGAILGNLNTYASYSSPFFFIGLGYQGSRDSAWWPYYNVGVQHRYTAPVNVAGTSNTTLIDTTEYTYRVQQESWLLMTKADIYKWKRFMPYLTAGMGVSFNRLSQFFDNSPTFTNQLGAPKKVTNDFSYSLGAGIDFIVKEDFWLSVGYFFDDFGKNSINNVVATNSGSDAVLGELKNATLHANSFYLKARYLFA